MCHYENNDENPYQDGCTMHEDESMQWTSELLQLAKRKEKNNMPINFFHILAIPFRQLLLSPIVLNKNKRKKKKKQRRRRRSIDWNCFTGKRQVASSTQLMFSQVEIEDVLFHYGSSRMFEFCTACQMLSFNVHMIWINLWDTKTPTQRTQRSGLFFGCQTRRFFFFSSISWLREWSSVSLFNFISTK